MEQEIILPNKKAMVEQEQKNALVLAMEDVNLNEGYAARLLKHIMENAVTETKKWDIIEDFSTKLSALKTWRQWTKDTPDVQIQIANVFQTGTNIL